MYHSYADKTFSNDQVDQMKSHDGPSRTYENFISIDELNYLREEIKKITYPEHGETSKYFGASFNDEFAKDLQKIFEDKLHELIGDHRLDFFAWQEAINPWKIHADLRWYADKLPYKVVLIPIDVESGQDNWMDTYTIAFKQRDYREGNTNTDATKKGNDDQSKWKRPFDKPGTRNLSSGYSITKQEHQKYFSHMDYSWLEGLDIDNIYKWTPCSAVVWDQNQLHCADNFLDKGIKTKRSLIFFTNQKT